MNNVNTIKKIKADSLRSQVYAQLKKQLLRGVWKSGEKLPSEKEFCRLFGVSRVTIRGAVQQLEILGLVETRQGGGTFVRDFSSVEKVDTFHPLFQIQKNQDLITVLEYRKIIEKGAAGIAGENISPEDIRFLEETYRTMTKDTGASAAYIEADLAFHYRLALAARNPIIIKVYDLLNDILSVAMKDIVRLLGRKIGLTYHRKIIDALKKGDKGECESIMEEHIEATISAVRKEIAAEGASSP
jgi:GntR family transcriptional repressor for pyruvate dehydrogenase complex